MASSTWLRCSSARSRAWAVSDPSLVSSSSPSSVERLRGIDHFRFGVTLWGKRHDFTFSGDPSPE
jgi:hypothetical protein